MYSMLILLEQLASALFLDRTKCPLRDVVARVWHRDDARAEFVAEVVVGALYNL
jgi:hypothetical protein